MMNVRFKNFIKCTLSKFHRHKKSAPDVFIFTLPRSGSTLLAEILNTDPLSKTVSEPFSLEKDNISMLLKYFDKSFLAERYVDIPEKDFKTVLKYLSDLSDGKTRNSFYWTDLFTSNHYLNTSRTLFKIHKLTYHFDDVMSRFKNDLGIYLIRNPIPHSLSRLRKGWATYIDLYSGSKKIKDNLPASAKRTIKHVSENGSGLEKFIVSWCLENYVFIKKYQENKLPSNLLPVFYEDLVLNPETTIKNICSKINMNYNDKMLQALNVPSSGIVHSTQETKNQILAGNKDYIINRWKEDVDPDTENRVKEILESFGIESSRYLR